jgi:hypothetical protein
MYGDGGISIDENTYRRLSRIQVAKGFSVIIGKKIANHFFVMDTKYVLIVIF